MNLSGVSGTILGPFGGDAAAVVMSSRTRHILGLALANRGAASELRGLIEARGGTCPSRIKLLLEEMLCSHQHARELSAIVEAGSGVFSARLAQALAVSLGDAEAAAEIEALLAG